MAIKWTKGDGQWMKDNIEKIYDVSINTCNVLAYESMKEIRSQYKSRIDRPVPFTIRGIQYDQATDSQQIPTATVYIKGAKHADEGDDGRYYYLRNIIKSGPKTRMPEELSSHHSIPMATIPAGIQARVNQYGNMRRGEVKRLMKEIRRAQTNARRAEDLQAANMAIFFNKKGIFLREGRRVKILVSFQDKVIYKRQKLESVPTIGHRVMREKGLESFARAVRYVRRTSNRRARQTNGVHSG